MKKILLILCLVMGQGVFAKTVTLDGTRLLTLSLSQSAINRLTLVTDEIENVFLSPTHLSNNVELDASGHLFITGDEMTREAYLSLVTSGGAVQDFKILFDAKEPEPTFLTSPKSEGAAPMPLERPDVAELLARARDGDLSGWSRSSLKAQMRVVEGLTATHHASYTHASDALVLHVFYLKGQGPLISSLFQKKGDLALVMNERTLTQHTKLLVIQERKQQ